MRRLAVSVVALAALVLASTASARVLLVGSFHGIKGQYSSIQAAVKAAKRGDWVLVGPGDYKTTSSHAPKGRPDRPSGVLITTPDLHLRGMNRNTVVVDGTKPGSSECSNKKSAQNFGPNFGRGTLGLNGIMVYKADDVWIQNLTACNFLGGSGGDGGTGNEIWWNGGDGSGQIGGWGFVGSYLNATSSYFGPANNPNKAEVTAAEYGIFSSNWSGGTWNQSYASNFNDSGYYIGACQQVCDQTINHGWGEYNALGYSGSNSGGQLVIENSQWDNNVDGINTNSQNGDDPSPQDGACPGNGVSRITHTHSCWVAMNNYVHNNNDPNVPQAGSAAAGPVGTGIVLSGSRNDTLLDNKIVNNDAWGVWFVFYPDTGPPCTGGTLSGTTCLFDDWGNALIDNKFGNNGDYGHPSNGDFQEIQAESGHPTNCFSGNTEIGGGSIRPASSAALQQSQPSCNGQPSQGGASDPNFLSEGLCDSQIVVSACPTGPYPQPTKIVMHRLPPAKQLPTMPNPCSGVPGNAWCRAGKPV
jgi:hypothetical protein